MIKYRRKHFPGWMQFRSDSFSQEFTGYFLFSSLLKDTTRMLQCDTFLRLLSHSMNIKPDFPQTAHPFFKEKSLDLPTSKILLN